MHWTDGRHVLKRDETAGRPASGASSKKFLIRLSTVEKQNSTNFFFIFLSTVEKAKAASHGDEKKCKQTYTWKFVRIFETRLKERHTLCCSL